MKPIWLTDEQRQLREVLDRVATTPAAPRARLAELGIMGATLPEAYGGLGFGLVEATIIAEALGKARHTAPFVETVVIAGGLIAELGTEQQCRTWLPAIADGSLTVALAFAEGLHNDPLRPRASVRRDGDEFAFEGTKAPVAGIPGADLVLITARCREGVSLHACPAAALSPAAQYATIDGIAASTIALGNLRLGADSLLGREDRAQPALERAIERGFVVQAAEQTGLMAHLIDATIAYLQQRRQFGAPLATFQVLQHRVADMLLAYEKLVSLVVKARFMDDRISSPAWRRTAVGAALLGMRGARHVGQEAVQLHGGMGVSEELSIGPALKRIYALETRLGSVEALCGRYASAMYSA